MERWTIALWPRARGQEPGANPDRVAEDRRRNGASGARDDGGNRNGASGGDRDEERWRLVRLLATLVAGALAALFGAMATALTSAPVWLVFVVVVIPVWVLLVVFVVAIWPYSADPASRPASEPVL